MTDCIRVFNEILDTVPRSQAAFEIARNSLTKTLQSRRVTRASVLYSYLNARRLGIGYDLYRSVYEALPRLTLDDIVGFEQKRMAAKPCRYIILGDEKELDMEALGRIGRIHRLTTEQIFGY